MLIVVAIMGGVFAILFTTFHSGQLSSAIDVEKIGLQEEARRVMYLISNDLRQTTVQEIKNNDPSANHIKFRLYSGYDTITKSPIWSDYVEYTYNSSNETLTRQTSAGTVTFTSIVQSSFAIDPTETQLSIEIVPRRYVRSTIELRYPLNMNVTVRNR